MSIIRGAPRRFVESSLRPVVSRLIGGGINPNTLTTFGTLVSFASATLYAFGHVRTGGLVLLLSGVFDMLDGKVAREGNGATRFGAFYDSTLDRLADAALFFGIAMYFLAGGVPQQWVVPGVAVSMTGMASALTISYARARAEGLGMECKVGVAQRAERIIGMGVPSLVFGAGPGGVLLLVIVLVLSTLAVITVVQRIVHVYKLTNQGSARLPAAAESPVGEPVLSGSVMADTSMKGSSSE